MKDVVRTVCQACQCECGVLAHVENGRIINIEGDPSHPLNKGLICVKGRSYQEFVHHADRLKYPLKRAGMRGEGKWKRISWDALLDELAERLTDIKDKYGSESIATLHGTGPRASLAATTLLAHALGSPNVISVDLHICFVPSLIAEGCTIANSIMMDVGPDYENAQCILVWGANPPASHPARGKDIIDAKQRGAKLIVVDPRRTALASKADLWLQVRPGTDAALALGILNTIIEEELYDKEFVNKWCYGFDKLQDHVKQYSPDKVAKITWIPTQMIREAARLYATTKPAAFHHRVAIEHNINSVQTDRAFILLIALTGNIDVKGGNLFAAFPRAYIPNAALLGLDRRFRPAREVEEKRIGSAIYPLASGPDALVPFVPAPLAVESMLHGTPYQLQAIYCAGGNPVVNIQESKAVSKALKHLELLIVTDFFMTPTAELADYVLPATMWIERDECCESSYVNYISARQKAIDPPYECWDDMKIAIELAKRIPWADRQFLPWNNPDELLDWMVSGMDITFADFKEEGYIIEPMQYKKFEETGFNTPTKKVELYSTIFEQCGYDPLPTYNEPPESPLSTPELLKDYPFILITGARYINYFHSEGRQISSLRKLAPDPEIEIHPQTANDLNISDGDWLWIETPRVLRERVSFRAKLTADIHPKVVHARHGWWFPEQPPPEHGCFNSNINVVLSGDPPREPICGSVPTRGTLCKIYKQEKATNK
jgi:anaerobic selenocysteine-containing dehydrogenase